MSTKRLDFVITRIGDFPLSKFSQPRVIKASSVADLTVLAFVCVQLLNNRFDSFYTHVANSSNALLKNQLVFSNTILNIIVMVSL